MEPEVRVAMTTPDLMITHEPSAAPLACGARPLMPDVSSASSLSYAVTPAPGCQFASSSSERPGRLAPGEPELFLFEMAGRTLACEGSIDPRQRR